MNKEALYSSLRSHKFAAWLRVLASCFGASCLLWACATEDLDVAYLYVPAFSVVVDGQPEPSAITDVRVVLGAESLGFYPLPARIPILGTGLRRVRLEPVVQRNGRSEERTVYDPYEAFEADLQLLAGRTDTIRPVIGYAEGANVVFTESFESPTSALILDLVDSVSAPLTQLTGAGVRTGLGSGRIAFSRDEPVFEVASTTLPGVSSTTRRIWVEFDYRGEVPLIVGLVGDNPTALPAGASRADRYSIGARDRADWQKFYFDILDAANREFVESGFRVALLAQVQADSAESRSVFIDNLRVVIR